MGLPVMLDDLRIALREVDVLATLTAVTYDEADWTDPDPGVVEGIASLLGLIKKSAAQAMVAFHQMDDAMCCVARPETGLVADRLAVDRPGRGRLVADQLAVNRTAEVGSLQRRWQ